MGSLFFERQRRSEDAMMACGAILHLPAVGDNPEITKYYGTRNFEVDGFFFQNALKDAPVVNYQVGTGQDKGSFSIIDEFGDIYELFSKYDDVIEDCGIILIECFEIAENVFESEIVLPGFIDSLSRPDTDNLINISAVNDMSRLGFLTGGRVISKTRCAAKFPIDGSHNPEFDPCGWIPEMGGNPKFCTHLKDGKDGCIDHGNKDRFYAIEGTATANVVVVPEIYSGIGGSGWDYYTDRMKEYPDYNYNYSYNIY